MTRSGASQPPHTPNKMLRYACFLSVILAVRSTSAPFIKPCKEGESDCILASAQYALPYVAVGVPDLGIKSLDPLHFDEVKGDQGNLKLTFKDTTVTGMKDCTIDAIKIDMSKNKQQMAVKCSVDLNGDYKLDGQLLIFPIKGEGKYHIKIRDIIIKAFTEMETVTGPDGQPHWHIKSWRHTYQTKTGARFNFENLFNGNKVLAQPVEEFVNTNWEEVMKEVAPPIVRAIVSRVVEDVEALYSAVPADQLYIQ